MDSSKYSIGFDFDGVFTDSTNHVADYRNRVFRMLTQLTGTSISQLEQECQEQVAHLEANPTTTGWAPVGEIAAFWNEGPQFLATATFELLLALEKYKTVTEEHFHEEIKNVEWFKPKIKAGKSDLYNVLEFHFRSAHTAVDHRYDQQLVNDLCNKMAEMGYAASMISTSPEQDIVRILGQVNMDIYGGTLKFNFDKGFVKYGENMQVMHGPHTYTVNNVRSKVYHDVIEKVEQKQGPMKAVVGDVFTLDLALPLAMGKHIILKKNDYTPAWSENYVHNHERGHVVEDIAEIPSLLERL